MEDALSKVDKLTSRLVSFENRANPIVAPNIAAEATLTDETITISKNQFQELVARMSALEKQNDNFRSRIIILETQYLVTKSSSKPSRESTENDRTVFHSFIDTTNVDDGDGNGNEDGEDADSLVEINECTGNGRSGVVQSLLITPSSKYGKVFQGMPVEYEKNELTPTNSITPKFETSQIMRAKDLVCR